MHHGRVDDEPAERRGHRHKPTVVSIVMPVLNEGRFIERAIRSLQSQRTPDFDLEILVVDGGSEDGTRETIVRLGGEDHRLKLLTNPSHHTPAAFNIGLRAAAGEYVCILGAHAEYDHDYISVCLKELLAHDAAGCSGKVITAPANSGPQAHLVAWAFSHPFASSTRSVRTQPEGYVDTVPFPILRKQALLDAGCYNERLLRNQDNDMNQRLRAMGYKLYATHKTTCRYFARPSIRSFLNYAATSGRWNALSLNANRASLSLRHLVPLLFVSSLFILLVVLAAALIAHWSAARIVSLALSIMLAGHWGLGALAGIQVSLREKTPIAVLLAPLIFAFHCCYGWGTLRGFLSTLPASNSRTTRGLPNCSRDPV